MKTKLTPELTDNICKKLKTGTYAKVAAESEGITERVYYKWIERGEEALKLAEKGIKYPESEEIFVQFVQSVRGVMIKCKFLLVAKVISNKVERLAVSINGILRKMTIQGTSLAICSCLKVVKQ